MEKAVKGKRLGRCILAALLCLLMLVSALPPRANAAGGLNVEVKYDPDNGGCFIAEWEP